MKVSAYAKINLTLEVYGKRPDGYHELKSIVQPIALADEIEIERTADGSISSDTGFADDLCVKAARVLGCGARISVGKHIPVGGGLGGGSADAAAVLLALNELYDLGKSPEELAAIGASVGSDVPALVLGQSLRRPILMEGRGERVMPLPNEPARALVLVNPGVFCSTAEVFAHSTPRTERPDGNVNDLQDAAMALHPEIARAYDFLVQSGAEDVMMSGSGATVFAFAKNDEDALRIVQSAEANGFKAWPTRTLSA